MSAAAPDPLPRGEWEPARGARFDPRRPLPMRRVGWAVRLNRLGLITDEEAAAAELYARAVEWVVRITGSCAGERVEHSGAALMPGERTLAAAALVREVAGRIPQRDRAMLDLAIVLDERVEDLAPLRGLHPREGEATAAYANRVGCRVRTALAAIIREAFAQ